MKRLLTPRLPVPGSPVELSPSEANHAIAVLRLRNGETVEAIDGRGSATSALLRVRGDSVFLDSAGTPAVRSAQAKEVVPMVLEVAVLKGDAMEWTVEKAVELGVRTLAPLLTAHTVVQVDRKGPDAFRERWQKIADQALKQCGRLERLEVLAPLPLEERLVLAPAAPARPRLWLNESARGESVTLLDWLLEPRETRPEGFSLLIGPEGGWSDLERRLLAPSTVSISLGPLVLRGETAAISAASLGAAYFRRRELDNIAQKKGD